MSDGSPLLRERGLKLFAKRSDSPANPSRKQLQDSPQTPARKERDGSPKTRADGDSPGLRHEPPVKLSDVSLIELTPDVALSNFRARKKTFGEYLAPLTSMFTTRRTSALERLSYRPSPSKFNVEEDERKRVRELMFGTPMRRFSLKNTHNIPRSGTLRVRVIACTSSKLKSNTTMTRKSNNSPLAEIRKVSGESTGSNSSGAGRASYPQPLGSGGRGRLRGKRPEIQYYVEMELGAARGKTTHKPKFKGSRRGEVRWDDSNAWVRLFVPGIEEGADPILLAVSEAAKQASGEGRLKSRRPLQVLHLRVMCVVRGNAEDDSEVHTPLFESAVELDRLIAKGAPRLLELPLVNKEDPEDEDLGVLTLETRFERLNPRRLSNEDLQFVEAAENLAAESASVLILAGRTPNLGLGTATDEMPFGQSGGRAIGILRDDDDSAVSPILMIPSAAAYLTTVAAGLVPTSLPLSDTGTVSNARMSQKLRVVYEHDESLRASWPLARREQARHRFETIFSDTSVEHKRLRKRFSCPDLSSVRLKTEGGELFIGANTEQLQSLREGWRMWRMAHRSQLQPSHRAKDLAMAGERFINRANSVGSGGNSPVNSLNIGLQRSPTSAGAHPPRSPRNLSDLESQPSTQRMRALFELGGESYDVSNYLDDHPHQRAFLNSISARVGKISKLEQQASLSEENLVDPAGPGAVSAKTRQRRKPSIVIPPTRPWSRRRIAVVTGATSGIGEVIGRKLCSMGVRKLIILVRSLSSGRSKALEWTEKYKNVEVDVIHCDLSDMHQTNAAADHVRDLLAPGERIDLLVLCAACVSNESTMQAKKEFEETFAVNYMANFLLVHALFDLMERPMASTSEDEARIIFAGCAAVPPFGNRVDLDDLQAEKRGIGQLGVAQYIHTKTMLICFASELARRLEDRHCFVTANVFFPGAVKSKLADRVLEAFNPVIARLADAAYGLTEGVLVRSPEQGAALALHLCSSPALIGVNGKVFHSGTTGIVTDFDPHPHFGIATNTELSRKLWAISGKMLNQALGKESRVSEWWGYFKPARPTQTKSQVPDNVPVV